MYRITYVLGPEEEGLTKSLPILLATLTMVNRAILEAHPEIPPLYKSQVKFETEPGNQDDWQDVRVVHKMGGGDCEDLACIRAAELQVQGVQAWPTVQMRKTRCGGLHAHSRVRLPNGKIEDPACHLGLCPSPDHSCTALGGGQRENRITFILDLFKGEDELRLSHRALQLLLTALTLINRNYLLRHPEAPLLYDAGVRYESEPPGREDWQDAPTNFARKEADCEDLATHRAAELQVRFGIVAWPTFTFKKRKNGSYLYHIVVRHPDGHIEDPSRKLGMR